MMKKWRPLAIALALALLQIAFLSWMINARAHVLRTGQTVLLKVQPYDPRDLLKGDYVRLNYDGLDLKGVEIRNRPADDDQLSRNDVVWARLKKQPDGYWRARLASIGERPTDAMEPDEVDVRGKLEWIWSFPGGVRFGVERYYVPEGKGRQIELDMRERQFSVLLAVGPDGVAQVKALMDGQTPLFEEPLY